MSEPETDRNALALYAPSYPAQVQAAGRQLGIAAQLNQDLERRRFVGILKRIDSKDAAVFLAIRQALDGDVIERFADHWDWYALSVNAALPWSLELIGRFDDRWDWRHLSLNESLPWSIELIELFEDRWTWGDDFGGISSNEALPWSLDLIERFDDRWDWTELSSNKALPWWSPDLIERFEDCSEWEWRRISSNEALPWSLELIEYYVDHWEWRQISSNEALPWSIDLIERFKDRWDWKWWLSINKALPWSLELIECYGDRWNWKWLSSNEALPWSLDLIERFEGRWDWTALSRNKALPWSLDLIELYGGRWNWRGLSGIKALPWSLDLIECYEDRWDWKWLSGNESLPWSLNLIECYKDRLDWKRLSGNEALPWSLDLIERYEDRWDWRLLSWQKYLPWSLELIARFEAHWDSEGFSLNEALPWSLNLIECYKDLLDWESFSGNEALALPLLRPSDIVEIMTHHFTDMDSETALPPCVAEVHIRPDNDGAVAEAAMFASTPMNFDNGRVESRPNDPCARRRNKPTKAALDPETLAAGITLAGYHIEKGARSFAAFSKAMLDDMGEAIRPYLKQFYMAVKYHPSAANWDGMSSAAEVEAVDVGDGTADFIKAPDGSIDFGEITAEQATTMKRQAEKNRIIARLKALPVAERKKVLELAAIKRRIKQVKAQTTSD